LRLHVIAALLISETSRKETSNGHSKENLGSREWHGESAFAAVLSPVCVILSCLSVALCIHHDFLAVRRLKLSRIQMTI
jgi:hypothetical protein